MKLFERGKKNIPGYIGLYNHVKSISCFHFIFLFTLVQSEYWKRGFEEVLTPNIYNSKLWETSGHWQHYADNMFSFEAEKETFALKPMNCPGHW